MAQLVLIPVVCGACKNHVYDYEYHDGDSILPDFSTEKRFYLLQDESEPSLLVGGFGVKCPYCDVDWVRFNPDWFRGGELVLRPDYPDLIRDNLRR